MKKRIDNACEKTGTAVPPNASTIKDEHARRAESSSHQLHPEPVLSKPVSVHLPAGDERRATSVANAVARPLTRRWWQVTPEGDPLPTFNVPVYAFPPQMAKLPDPFKTYNRWKRLGFPESMRRERRARANASLEPSQNEVRSRSEPMQAEPGRDVIRIIGCGCGRHVCPSCGRRLGFKVRENIKARIKALQRKHGCEGDMQMWTLTGDQKRFESPEKMWEHVRDRRLISRTMQAVGCVYYVAVIEWHASGWPHWHVLVWQPVKRMHVSHDQVEHHWTLGICRFTARNGRPMEWAANYATKYLCKPDEGVPSWVMNRAHIRSVWASRPWGRVCTVHAACQDEDEENDGLAGSREYRSNAEAVASCASSCTVIQEHVSREGQMCRRWLGRVNLHRRIVRRLVERVTGSCHRAMVVAADSAEWRRLRSAIPLVE